MRNRTGFRPEVGRGRWPRSKGAGSAASPASYSQGGRPALVTGVRVTSTSSSPILPPFRTERTRSKWLVAWPAPAGPTLCRDSDGSWPGLLPRSKGARPGSGGGMHSRRSCWTTDVELVVAIQNHDGDEPRGLGGATLGLGGPRRGWPRGLLKSPADDAGFRSVTGRRRSRRRPSCCCALAGGPTAGDAARSTPDARCRDVRYSRV